MATGAVHVGQTAVPYLQLIMLQQVDSLMDHAWINSIVPAENMIVTVLILMAAAAKGIQHLLKRLSLSRLTLETDSSTLHLQIQPHSLQQESLQQEQQGDDENANGDNDDGGIPPTNQRPQF